MIFLSPIGAALAAQIAPALVALAGTGIVATAIGLFRGDLPEEDA